MYKMMAIEEEHVYRATRLPNAIVERHLSPSPVSRPHSSPRPGVLRAEGVDFASPSLHAKSRSFEGKEAPGALGPVAAEVARVQPRLVVHLPAARTSIRGPQADPRHPGVAPSRAPSSLRNGAAGEEVADAVHTSLTHPRARPAMWASRRTRRSARAIAG